MISSKVNRRISVSVLLLLLALFCTCPARAIAEPEHQYEYYLIVDGTEYDATQDHMGTNWSSSYDPSFNDGSVHLTLDNYQGGGIATNLDLGVTFCQDCHITGKEFCGIYSSRNVNLYALPTFPEKDVHLFGHGTVVGASGYPAVWSAGVLSCGNLTAQGGGVPALQARTLDIHYGDPNRWMINVYSGTSPETAEPVPEYSGQPYFSLESQVIDILLEGNGGTTPDGLTSFRHVYNYPESGAVSWRCLSLGYYSEFTKPGTVQLGWRDENGQLYQLDEYYDLPAGSNSTRLWAVWQDETHKGVSLNNYYGFHGNVPQKNGIYPYRGATVVNLVQAGETYVLPDQQRLASTFDGWLGEDGTLYPAGSVISVRDSVSFTAQFTSLPLLIDGKQYDANQSVTAEDNSWSYSDNQPSGAAFLDIQSNYSGAPITVPDDVQIMFHSGAQLDIWGNSAPAITVHGNAEIVLVGADSSAGEISIIGGQNAPAVSVDGELQFSIYGDDMNFLTLEGGVGQPALSAASLQCNSPFSWAGESSDTLSLVSAYSRERLLKLTNPWPYWQTFRGPCTIPALPENDDYRFIGWSPNVSPGGRTGCVYLPNDSLPAGNTILSSIWVRADEWAVLLHGNGGASRDRLSGTMRLGYIGNAIFLPSPSPFLKTGYQLIGYTEQPDGSGICYAPGGIVDFDGQGIHHLYAKWAPLELPEAYYVFISDRVPFDDGSYCKVVDRSRPFAVPTLHREGYDFIGWTSSENGNSIDVEHVFPEAAFPPDQNLYLYPIFRSSSECGHWLILSPGEGDIVPYWHAASPGNAVAYFFQEYEESDNRPDLYLSHMHDMEQYSIRRPGYTLIGWNTAPDGSGTFYAPGEPITFMGIKTILYAQWEKTDYQAVIRQNKLEITFDQPLKIGNHYFLAAYTPFERQMVHFSTPVRSGETLIFDAPDPHRTPEIRLFTCDEHFAPMRESRLITISPSE